MAKMTANVPEILGLLPGDNCRECGLPTCIAFAAKVFLGERGLTECPRADADVALPERFVQDEPDQEERPADFLQALKARAAQLDLQEAAARLGLPYSDGRIVVRCLGKVFEVDSWGELHSDCHVHAWVHVPVLYYLLDGQGIAPSGDWVRFAELKGAADWERFFAWRCEQGFSRILSEDPELLFDVLALFRCPDPAANTGDLSPAPDFSACLDPLPGVRLLFVGWLPDDEFDAKLTLLFDRSSEHNLNPRALYFLTQGLLEMVMRIWQRHAT